MIYIGVDPSFTKTGVCYLNTRTKEIVFNAISPPGTNDTYKDTLDRSGLVAIGVLKNIDMMRDAVAIIEEPLVSSIKASSLGILSGIVAWSLAFMPSIKRVYSVSPTYISSMNRKIAKSNSLNKKQASLYIVSALLELFSDYGYRIRILNDKYNKDGTMKARKLSHDEAEAFMLTLLLMLETNALEDEIRSKLSSINKEYAKKQTITKLKGE